jgi:NADPH2:quinone reductase
MRAVPIEQYGGPEVLVAKDVDLPKAKADEVVVRVAYAGINFLDTQMRDGSYQTSQTYETTLPMILGQEGAGTVAEVGAAVKNFQPGDRVSYFWNYGSYAEYCAVPAYRVVKVPEQVSLKAAASLMMQGLTAQYLVYSTAALKPGDTCLMHAAAGGVGQIMVQLAKHRGAIVIASVGNAEKAKIAKDLGADHAVIYRETDFRDEVMKITNGRGVDVVFDSIGKDTIERSLHSVRQRGLCVLFGGASGLVREINPQKLADAGSIFFTRPHLAHHVSTAAETNERAQILFNLLLTNELKVSIFREFPLEDARLAHEMMQRGETKGKILLTVNGSEK